jgi:hypothetical protein
VRRSDFEMTRDETIQASALHLTGDLALAGGDFSNSIKPTRFES